MSAALELVPELAIVVDLAVQDHDHRSILVLDRLVPGLQVDHPKALDAEADPGLDERPSRVRAAMLDGGAHPLEQRWIDAALRRYLSGDATHERETLGTGPGRSLEPIQHTHPAVSYQRRIMRRVYVAPSICPKLIPQGRVMGQGAGIADELGARPSRHETRVLTLDLATGVTLERQDGDPTSPRLEGNVGHALVSRCRDDGERSLDELKYAAPRDPSEKLEVRQSLGSGAELRDYAGRRILCFRENHSKLPVRERLREPHVFEGLLIRRKPADPDERLRLLLGGRHWFDKAGDRRDEVVLPQRRLRECELLVSLSDDRVSAPEGGAKRGAVGPWTSIEGEVKIVSAGVDELSSMNLAEQGPSDETGSTRPEEVGAGVRNPKASPDAEGFRSAAHRPPTSAKRGALNDGWHPWLGRRWIVDRPHDVCYPHSTGGQRPRQQDRLELRSSTRRTGSPIVLCGQRHVYREVELGFRHVEADAFRSRGAPYAPR